MLNISVQYSHVRFQLKGAKSENNRNARPVGSFGSVSIFDEVGAGAGNHSAKACFRGASPSAGFRQRGSGVHAKAEYFPASRWGLQWRKL